MIYFDAATPSLVEKTKAWALQNLNEDKIRANDWLFMAYHASDFYFAVDEFPDLPRLRNAAIDNIVACAEAMPAAQHHSLFAFAPTPDSRVAKALPPGLLNRCLDSLAQGQQPDGHWLDQHNLPQWYPATTINALLALRRYGRC